MIIQPEDDITHVGTASSGTKTMKPARGVVLAVGTTKALGNGGRHAMDVRLGDLVIYTKVRFLLLKQASGEVSQMMLMMGRERGNR